MARIVASSTYALVDQLLSCDDLVLAIRSGSRCLSLATAAESQPPGFRRALADTLDQSIDRGDRLFQWFALRALYSLRAPSAERRVSEALSQADALSRQAGAFASLGHVTPAVVPMLVSMLSGEPFERMLAQLALLSADPTSPPGRLVAELLSVNTFDQNQAVEARRSSIECLAHRANGRETRTKLRSLASDVAAGDELRAAAVRALGDLGDADSMQLITQLARNQDAHLIAQAAAEALGCLPDSLARKPLTMLAQQYRHAADAPSPGTHAAIQQSLRRVERSLRPDAPSRGLRIAQVSMRGGIDLELRGLGDGDSGGLATLLVSLGEAFARHPAVEQAYTVTRAVPPTDDDSPGGRRLDRLHDSTSQLVRIPFGPAGPMSADDMWGSLLQIERGLRLFFGSVPVLDGLHLRFADGGTWAAARWAQSSGVPLHFTLAPDPYVPIRSAQQAGRLSRESFAQIEAREHYLYRAHVLDWMVEHAAGLALLPRPNWEMDLPYFFGISLPALALSESKPKRIRVIPEGINLGLPDPGPRPHRVDGWTRDLSAQLARHPDRSGKPVLLTVGRLHEVKGIARLVEAWAGDPDLREEFNLIVVGGNLISPSEHERRVLAEIGLILAQHRAASQGLVLLGSRSNREVAGILGSLRDGVPGVTAPHAIYICASDKEEFGLAILEALAAGLLVVAPADGGPPTYIEHGKTGFLADTRDLAALQRRIRQAAATRTNATERASMTRRARAMVRNRYSIDRMAAELVELYAAFAPSSLVTEVAS